MAAFVSKPFSSIFCALTMQDLNLAVDMQSTKMSFYLTRSRLVVICVLSLKKVSNQQHLKNREMKATEADTSKVTQGQGVHLAHSFLCLCLVVHVAKSLSTFRKS